MSGFRLLEVGPRDGSGSIASALAGRGVAEIVTSDRPQELLETGGGRFGFVVCRNALRVSQHPMALLADLWRLAAAGGTLLLDAEVLSGPEHSAYARFMPGAGNKAGWLTGRLALRWMIEISGFDVDRRLAETDGPAGPRACLRATRSEREPARSAP